MIPYDRNRVILTPDGARPHSTYINASFIEGYFNDESFIITQDPLQVTNISIKIFSWQQLNLFSPLTLLYLAGDSSGLLADGGGAQCGYHGQALGRQLAILAIR